MVLCSKYLITSVALTVNILILEKIAMKKIIIVDDSPLIRKKMSGKFPRDQYEIVTASNGSEALQFIQANTFDCMLLDINMPEMNGIELLKALQQNALKLPTIILTSDTQESTKNECMSLGAGLFFAKPNLLQGNDILEIVATFLAGTAGATEGQEK